jgi:hypothetical protein
MTSSAADVCSKIAARKAVLALVAFFCALASLSSLSAVVDPVSADPAADDDEDDAATVSSTLFSLSIPLAANSVDVSSSTLVVSPL